MVNAHYMFGIRFVVLWSLSQFFGILILLSSFFPSSLPPSRSIASQKDEVYLNLVLDFIPETVYRVIRHHSKARQIMPILYIKVRGLVYDV